MKLIGIAQHLTWDPNKTKTREKIILELDIHELKILETALAGQALVDKVSGATRPKSLVIWQQSQRIIADYENRKQKK